MGNYNAFEEPKKRFDSFASGFLLSVILPMVVLFLVLAVKDSAHSLEERFTTILHDMYFIRYITLALVPNLVLFFFFYKTERWKACYGLSVATLVYLMLSVFQMV